MGLINSVLKFFLEQRLTDITRFMENPSEVQQLVYKNLILSAKSTVWGKKYGYEDNLSIEDFQSRVPISTYEQIFPYIERMLKGENNVLWPTKIEWFSKSSGTTNDRSKFIPVSQEALDECHNKCGKDMLTLYINNFPDTKVFDGKSLSIGGTHYPNPYNPETRCGDVSAIFVQNIPAWAEFVRAPSREVFLMEKWEEKIEKMVETTIDENITSLSGVPTWMVLVLQKVLERSGKGNIKEVWPNLEVFLHGAVSFLPYRDLFGKLISSPDFRYIELYNASEGFFGVQDIPGSDDMLLMLDHGVFYEFILLEDLEMEHPKTLLLHQVELNKNYAIVISTNAGLWRYLLGDTVRFTSIVPYRIKISGRTKHFINAFGEEVMVENADMAISKACLATDAEIKDFTAAPVYLNGSNRGGHEWLIEFIKHPSSIDLFTDVLDKTLREINSDYDAKRYKDIALVKPLVKILSEGTFYKWLKTKNKLGGQNKVPRLSNNRIYVDEIMSMS